MQGHEIATITTDSPQFLKMSLHVILPPAGDDVVLYIFHYKLLKETGCVFVVFVEISKDLLVKIKNIMS